MIYYTGYIIFLGAALNRHLDDLARSPGERGEGPRAEPEAPEGMEGRPGRPRGGGKASRSRSSR